MSSPLHRKAIKSLDINLIVEGVFYLTVVKNCWSILSLTNPKDLFTGRKLELSLNLFKQAVKTAPALSCGNTIMLWAPPPHHHGVKTPSVHHQTVSMEYTFSHSQVFPDILGACHTWKWIYSESVSTRTMQCLQKKSVTKPFSYDLPITIQKPADLYLGLGAESLRWIIASPITRWSFILYGHLDWYEIYNVFGS